MPADFDYGLLSPPRAAMQTATDAIPRRIVPFLSPTGLRGSLQGLPLPEILQHLRRTGGTGILSLEHEGTRKAVYFRRGRVVFATSNAPSDRLGENLLRLGKISVDEYEESLTRISHGRRQGKVLIEMGAMSPKDLWEGVEAQVREIVFSLFEWPGGDFVFEENSLPEKEKVTVSFDPIALLLEGLRRVDPEGDLKQRYPDRGLILEPVRIQAPAPLEPHEEHILSLVDGLRSVDGICRESEIGDAETLKTLYALFCTGLVRVRGRRVRAVDAESRPRDEFEETLRPFNSMFSFIYRYLIREMGPAGEEQIALAVARLAMGGGLLIGCDVRKDGTLDPAPLRGLYRQLSERERASSLRNALNEVLYGLLFAVRESIGADHEANVLKALKAGAPSA
jgi:hypothetical protein